MGTYKITDNVTGKTVTVSGETAPTETDAEKIFADAGLRGQQEGDTLDRIGSMIPSASKSLSNVPKSMVNYVQNTIKGLMNAPEIAGRAAAKSPTLTVPFNLASDPELVNGFLSNMKERYGSWDKVVNTIEQDPIGVLGDASIVYGKVDPTRAITGPMKWAAGKVAPRTLQSALKIPTSVPMQTRSAITEEALKQPIFKTLEGRHALAKEGIQAIEQRMGDAIAQADAAGMTAKSSEVANALDDLANSNTMARGPLYKQNQAAVMDVKDSFLNNPNNLMPGGEYPLSLAQAMKKATYDDITRAAAGKAYQQTMKGGTKAVTPDVAAMQTQASTLADQVYTALESQYPELRGLGKQEGAKIGLKQAIEAAVPRIANTELMNLGMPAGVVMGEILGGSGGAKAMLGAKLIERIPAVKAALAVALYKSGKLKSSKLPPYAYATGQYLTPEDTNE